MIRLLKYVIFIFWYGIEIFKLYNLCVLYFFFLKDINDDLEEELVIDFIVVDISIDENGK